MVYAIDFTTGKTPGSTKPMRHSHPASPENTAASETPVTDARVCMRRSATRHLYDFSGKVVWSSPEGEPTRSGWGTASFRCCNGRCIVNDNDGGSQLTAIDAATGKTIACGAQGRNELVHTGIWR